MGSEQRVVPLRVCVYSLRTILHLCLVEIEPGSWAGRRARRRQSRHRRRRTRPRLHSEKRQGAGAYAHAFAQNTAAAGANARTVQEHPRVLSRKDKAQTYFPRLGHGDTRGLAQNTAAAGANARTAQDPRVLSHKNRAHVYVPRLGHDGKRRFCSCVATPCAILLSRENWSWWLTFVGFPPVAPRARA